MIEWSVSMASPSGDDAPLGRRPEPRRLEASHEVEEITEAAIPLPAPEPTSDDLPTDTRVGEYVVTGKIGQGGMGGVFAAVHPLIGKKAAVKVISGALSSDGGAVQRFVDEARTVNRIGHPNIVDVFSFGTLADGRSYFVMEYLVGETLGGRMRRGPMDLEQAFAILDQISDALEAAHEKGVVHRDLKPENVFLAEARAGRQRVKLLDFGIAKLVAKEAGQRGLTETGFVMGSPGYVSPEQARGKPVDGRSDVYALGALAYEMLARRAPFVADNAVDLVVAHCTQPPPPLGPLAPHVPADVVALIMATLAKKPEDRPTLTLLRKALAAAVDLGAQRTPHPRLRSEGAPPATGVLVQPRSPVTPAHLKTMPTGSNPELRELGNVARSSPPSAAIAPTMDLSELMFGETAMRPATEIPVFGVPAQPSTAMPELRSSRRRLVVLGAGIALGLAGVLAFALLRDGGTEGITAQPIGAEPPPVATEAPRDPAPATRKPVDVVAPPVRATPPRVAQGRLLLDLDGQGARVRVDGLVPERVNDTTTLALATGPHAIEIAFPDGRTVRRQIVVTADKAQTIALAAPPAARPKKKATTVRKGGDEPSEPPRGDKGYMLDPFKR